MGKEYLKGIEEKAFNQIMIDKSLFGKDETFALFLNGITKKLWRLGWMITLMNLKEWILRTMLTPYIRK